MLFLSVYCSRYGQLHNKSIKTPAETGVFAIVQAFDCPEMDD
ncbi:hypothetical protein AAKU52_003194 [Pedobacter sp. CG_S7]